MEKVDFEMLGLVSLVAFIIIWVLWPFLLYHFNLIFLKKIIIIDYKSSFLFAIMTVAAVFVGGIVLFGFIIPAIT